MRQVQKDYNQPGWRKLLFGTPSAIKITIIYAVVGCLWILLSDLAVEWFIRERTISAELQTLKGLLYVLGTSLLIYWLANQAFQKLQEKVREDQRADAENMLKVVLDNLGDAVFIIDPPSRTIRSTNAAAETLFGYEPDELVGRNSEILHVDHDSYIRFAEIGEPIIEDQGIFRCGYQMKQKDGTIIDTENTVVVLDKKVGWQSGVVSIVRDITTEVRALDALRKSEEQYRLLAENTLDVIWSMNMDLEFTYVNPAIEKLAGFTREEFIGTSLRDHFNQEAYEELERVILDEIRKGPSRGGVVLKTELRRKDGLTVPVEVHGRILFDENRPVGIQGTSRDITERLALETQVLQAQKLEAIGTLSGGIAHDFNNILGIIFGYVHMAKKDAPPGTQYAEDLDNVLIAANRAKDLVKQILAFSRQAQVERTPLLIQPLIKEGVKMLRSSIPSTISIIEEVDPTIGTVMADPTQVHQILMNLCTNAYHAMESTGGVLSVRLNKTVLADDNQEKHLNLPPGEYAELVVSDTGTGIGPDIIEKIFDPFFTTKEKGKGTGMGLSIIHGILMDYGGTITVESKLGEGSTFHVCFPVTESEEHPEEKESEDIPKGRERILFVDDEKLLAEMGKIMLERLGYQVTIFCSSLKALEAFKQNPGEFDLIITDQTMPELTGSDLSRMMLQIRSDIPIILCTGYSNLIDEDSAKAIGIKEFVLKPLPRDVIAKLVRKVLDAQ